MSKGPRPWSELVNNKPRNPNPKAVHAVMGTRRMIRDRRIKVLAKFLFEREGDLEFDGDAVVSHGDDNGAYVQCWKWVPFDGTEFDKTTTTKKGR